MLTRLRALGANIALQFSAEVTHIVFNKQRGLTAMQAGAGGEELRATLNWINQVCTGVVAGSLSAHRALHAAQAGSEIWSAAPPCHAQCFAGQRSSFAAS